MKTGQVKPYLWAAGLLLALPILSGCSGNSSVGPSGNSTSLVRSFNGLQGCPANVDFSQVNVRPASFSNVAYGTAPAGYTSLRAGTGLNYAVYSTGQTTNPLATNNSVDLDAHSSGINNTGTFTLTATGVCGSATAPNAPVLVRLIDKFPTTFTGTNAGTVALRVVNLVPDSSGGITLESNGLPLNGSDATATSNVPYAGNGTFRGDTYNSGINLSGSPTLTIRTNGNAVLATVPQFNFQPNHAYTLFVVGEVNPTQGGQAITVVPVQDF